MCRGFYLWRPSPRSRYNNFGCESDFSAFPRIRGSHFNESEILDCCHYRSSQHHRCFGRRLPSGMCPREPRQECREDLLAGHARNADWSNASSPITDRCYLDDGKILDHSNIISVILTSHHGLQRAPVREEDRLGSGRRSPPRSPLIIACDACGTVIDLDLTVSPRSRRGDPRCPQRRSMPALRRSRSDPESSVCRVSGVRSHGERQQTIVCTAKCLPMPL